MNPKISIITVCYNAENHIKEAIESVINQTYENKEYIIIDGDSKDGTISIINNYLDRIDVFVSEPDNGISDAFNKGILRASGDIIGICNADDHLTEGALQEIANQYVRGIDVYRFPEYIWDSQADTKTLIRPNPIRRIPILSHLLHMGCWITKDAYKEYGLYDVSFKYCMDYELIRRYVVKGAHFKYCDYPVGVFRLGGISQSNRIKINKEKLAICKKYGKSVVDGYVWILFDFMKEIIKNYMSKVK